MNAVNRARQLESIDIAELCQRPLGSADPMLVTGITATSVPWSPNYVVQQVGSTEVPVTDIVGGNYLQSTKRTLSVRAYFDEINRPLAGNRFPYISELSYDKHFPALAEQLVQAPDLTGEHPLARVMYFGRSVHSQIHYHTSGSAMLFCLHGRKLVRLYAPDQTEFLYKVPHRNFSEVLITSLENGAHEHDAVRYPKFSQASYYECVVGPGDVLFIPIYWWHSVQNFAEISLSAVYFWRQNWRKTWREILPTHWPPSAMREDYLHELLRRTVLRPFKRSVMNPLRASLHRNRH